MKATIFDIERSSFSNGPGIRTTVFFKGCNLKCAWCHNPESQSFKKEIMFYKSKCTKCGRCAGINEETSDFLCFADAKEICGKEYLVNEVFEEIIKDKSFYDVSQGGVTFSGGECMLQEDFLLEILKTCKENGIHTAVDTAGNVPLKSFEKIMPYTDLFLYDIKAMDNITHKKYTGSDNKNILCNLKYLLKSATALWVRIPIVTGVNDTKEEMLKVKEFFKENGFPQKIELLAYHALGEHKYEALGKKCLKFDVPEDEKMAELKKIFENSI